MLKESESQFAQFFPGMIPGRRMESWTSLQTRYLGGANRPAFTKLIEFARLFEDRPSRF